MLTGLSRTVLKCTVPGVPDFYQGTEMWDLALVDPDNRRACGLRQPRPLHRDAGAGPGPACALARRPGQAAGARTIAGGPGRDAEPRCLRRLPHPESRWLVRENTSSRLPATNGSERLAVVVPRLVAKLAAEETAPLGAVWRASVAVPAGRWRDIITGDVREIGPDGCPVSELFAALPFSVLRLQP